MVYRFEPKNEGEYVEGVPARDIADDEFDTLPVERKQAALDTGVYVYESDKPARGRRSRSTVDAREDSSESTVDDPSPFDASRVLGAASETDGAPVETDDAPQQNSEGVA